MRKLKKKEQLIAGAWYIVKGKPFKSEPTKQKVWILKINSLIDEGERGVKVFEDEEVFIGADYDEGKFKFNGGGHFYYDDVMREGATFYELTPKEKEEWKLKLTESKI